MSKVMHTSATNSPPYATATSVVEKNDTAIAAVNVTVSIQVEHSGGRARLSTVGGYELAQWAGYESPSLLGIPPLSPRWNNHPLAGNYTNIVTIWHFNQLGTSFYVGGDIKV